MSNKKRTGTPMRSKDNLNSCNFQTYKLPLQGNSFLILLNEILKRAHVSRVKVTHLKERSNYD